MNFLTENLTSFRVQANTPEEAIRKAGELLAKEGHVENRYIDAMIESYRTNGPYIVVAPQIALPHARPENGVKEACASMVQLETPIKFGSETNDPVKLIFALGASTSSEHLELLKKLMSLLENRDTVQQLLSAASYKNIKPYLG